MKHINLPDVLPENTIQRRGFLWIKVGGLLAVSVVVTTVFLSHRRRQRRALITMKRASPQLEFEYEHRDDWARDLSQIVENWALCETPLEALVGLDLRNPETTDAHLANLKGATQLQWLDLSDTRVTDSGLVLLEGLENLNRLWLTNTDVTDAALVHLKCLENLETLCLTGARVTDAGLHQLSGLEKLK